MSGKTGQRWQIQEYVGDVQVSTIDLKYGQLHYHDKEWPAEWTKIGFCQYETMVFGLGQDDELLEVHSTSRTKARKAHKRAVRYFRKHPPEGRDYYDD